MTHILFQLRLYENLCILSFILDYLQVRLQETLTNETLRNPYK